MIDHAAILTFIFAVALAAVGVTAYRFGQWAQQRADHAELAALGSKHASDMDRWAQLNEFGKIKGRREAVPEMIAAGELAEVIELEESDGPRLCIENVADKCHGCRYAGRYVLPLPTAADWPGC